MQLLRKSLRELLETEMTEAASFKRRERRQPQLTDSDEETLDEKMAMTLAA